MTKTVVTGLDGSQARQPSKKWAAGGMAGKRRAEVDRLLEVNGRRASRGLPPAVIQNQQL